LPTYLPSSFEVDVTVEEIPSPTTDVTPLIVLGIAGALVIAFFALQK
jgi:hypothetical protein